MKSASFQRLEKKIRTKQAKVAVLGLGYVGLPLVEAFAKSGLLVTGIDVDKGRIRSLEQGKSYIPDVASESLSGLMKKNRFRATSDFEVLKEMDIVIICVPTPLSRVKDPDISYIVSAAEAILKRLQPGKLIILESTTYPGTTEEIILPVLERSKLKVGRDFFLCFSPERIDPGNSRFHVENIPKVVGGVTQHCTRLGGLLYQHIIKKIHPVSSPRTAEMAKLLENTFRIVNIGLINELARAASSLKVDIWEAIEAAKTKPFGFMPFYPGPGIGGHCIGVDPIYLSWKARILGLELHFIELARRMNAEMPRYIVSQAVYALNHHQGKAISRSKIMLLGVTYKKDVPDIRESPALAILKELQELGAKVSYHDPYVPEIRHESLSLVCEPLNAGLLREKDLVLLVTDHSCFQYPMILKNSRLIFDTRNALRHFKDPHIVRL